MDHAGAQLEKLATGGRYVSEALDQIRIIYEQSRDWTHAIAAARRLEGAQGESRRALIAQYECAIDDETRREKKDDIALRHVRCALDEDGDCVRANPHLGVMLEAPSPLSSASPAYVAAIHLLHRTRAVMIDPLNL